MGSSKHRRFQIAVVGAGTCSAEVRALAEAVGTEIARRGATLVCGGLGGVMEAAACGAQRAGGLTVGVLPSYDRRTANRCLDVVLPTGFGYARNVIVVASGDAVIALPGEHGTAAEIALALKLGRCVIGLQAWEDYIGILHAGSAREAVDLALQIASGSD
jgi:uncharacterized protein (TIGR00725 family)